MDRSNNTNKNLKDQHVPGNVKYTKLSYNSMYSNFNVLGLYTKKLKGCHPGLCRQWQNVHIFLYQFSEFFQHGHIILL